MAPITKIVNLGYKSSPVLDVSPRKRSTTFLKPSKIKAFHVVQVSFKVQLENWLCADIDGVAESSCESSDFNLSSSG
jgi:hypothetical protein